MSQTIPVKSRSRTTLMACLVLLGLQFLFPIALRANETAVVLEECTFPLTGPEEEGSSLDGDSALDLSSVHAPHLCAGSGGQRGSALLHADADRLALSLLPAAGLHPSAP